MANRKDPAWKYGVEVEMEQKGYKYIQCIFCDKIITGGVYRMKEHLSGVHRNVAPCPEVTPEAKDEIKKYMSETKNTKKQAQKAWEERIDHSISFTSPSVGGSNSGSVSQRRIRGSMDSFMVNVNEHNLDLEGEKKHGDENEARYKTCMDISKFFFENGIAFNIVNSPSFINMCRSIGNYGRGLKLPTPDELHTTILKEETANTRAIVDEIMKTWPETGVSILLDGWKDMKGKQLVNLLVNNPRGTVFLKSIDVSDAMKDAVLMFKVLDDVVEEVGEDLVVQVVTNDASNYKKVGEMLMEKRKRLWWMPCATHCIDLMLKKVGELPQHKNALLKAKKVSNFIYNDEWVLSLMRSHTNKDLVRPALTRFTTAYLTLQSMYSLKQPLEQMFTSKEWEKSIWAKRPEGKAIKKIILRDESFWSSMSYALKTTRPIVDVMRMMNSVKMPGMGFIYGAINKAKVEIAENLGGDIGAYKEIWEIIDKKWEFQLHHHLHVAAYFLNPQFQYGENLSTHQEIKLGLFICMEKLIPNKDDRVKADLQIDDFKNKKGLFSHFLAKATVYKRSPVDWWSHFGIDTLELRSFAMRVLSLTCSSTVCERNWNTFNLVHTKCRNRLAAQKLNSLVYIMYNRRLQHRFLKKQALNDNEDPLLSDDVPSDDEWVIGEDHVGQKSMDESLGVDMSQPSGSRQVGKKRKKSMGFNSLRQKKVE